MITIATRSTHARSPMPAMRADGAPAKRPETGALVHVLRNGNDQTEPEIAAGPACKRILIADRHEVVRAGLKSILKAHNGWRVIAEASDGKEAIRQAVTAKPDIAIIDYALPVINGIEVTRQIRARAPETEVMAFTAQESDEIVDELLHAGARGFVLKSDGTQYVIAAVQALAAHKPFLTDTLSARLISAFLSGSDHRNGNLLTPCERVVVQLIAEGRGNKEIGGILNRSQKTIEAHRATAMRKAGVTSTAGLVRYAVRNKLVEP